MKHFFLLPLLIMVLQAHAESAGIMGYIQSIPPESDKACAQRHLKIAERRKGPIVLVHRGASAFAPENTLEAYAAAMGYGADGCEVDIRRTADGIFVMFPLGDIGSDAGKTFLNEFIAAGAEKDKAVE